MKNNHFVPVPIQAWIDAHPHDDSLLWSGSGVEQAVFIRDQLARVISRTYEEWQACATVISEHTSKSVRLPVVMLQRCGLTVVLRDNFHGFAISVQRRRRLSIESTMMRRLITHGMDKAVGACYCEGFPDEMVFGPYLANRQRFTVHVANKYDAHTFLRIIAAGWF